MNERLLLRVWLGAAATGIVVGGALYWAGAQGGAHIAWTRKVRNIGSVAVINVFLGWTSRRLGRGASDGRSNRRQLTRSRP